MAIAPQVTTEPIPTADYARLEERILARDQQGASQALYGLMKLGRPITEITRETVRIHAPYTNVPFHQRLDDGVVKFVNNDHCLLSERVGLPLRTMVRPELAWLPMAQTVWYMPTGLDPWNQLLGKAPGHYTRLYELAVDKDPPKPQIHWPDKEPLATEGPIRERLNHWLTLVQRGEVLHLSRVPRPHGGRPNRRRCSPTRPCWPTDAQDRMCATAPTRPAHKSYRARARSSCIAIGWDNAHHVLYASVPDIAVGPAGTRTRWAATWS
jgi:hypothetical protein